jgi:hypothetical protein
MAVYCKVVTISETDYPDDPQIVLPFEPSSITAQFMGGESPVSISFGDKQDAAILLPDILSPGSFYDWTNQRWVKNIFLKVDVGSSILQIIAEE